MMAAGGVTDPDVKVFCAGLPACKPSRPKGRLCILLSRVVYSRKGPPGPAPLTASEVHAPWMGLLPQYSWPPSDRPTAGAVFCPAQDTTVQIVKPIKAQNSCHCSGR